MPSKVLVTLVDESHLERAKALFASAHFKGGWDGDYMILAHGIEDRNLTWFKKKGICVKHCEPIKDCHKERPGWLHIFIAKLYVFQQDMKRWEKVVYLDVDCIVRASLDKLTEVKKIAGVPFYHNKYHKYYKEEKIKSVNLFNTGVFSFDTSVVKSDTFESMLSIAEDLHQEFPDGINLMSHEEIVIAKYFNYRFEKLPIVFNVIPIIASMFNVLEKNIKGIIIHLASYNFQDKPWVSGSRFYPEWKNNLDQADKIDIKIPKKPAKKWTSFSVRVYQYWFKYLYIFRLPNLLCHRLLGETGLFIKKINPKIYYFLKKYLKNEKKSFSYFGRQKAS